MSARQETPGNRRRGTLPLPHGASTVSEPIMTPRPAPTQDSIVPFGATVLPQSEEKVTVHSADVIRIEDAIITNEPEEAAIDFEKRLEEITGEEGIGAVESDLDKMIQARMQMITRIQGEIVGYKTALRLLLALRKHYGLTTTGEKSTWPEATPTPEPKDVGKEFDELVKKRLTEHKCVFRDQPSKGGKWCERKLTTKPEKESGYCEIHMNVMGIE